MYSNIIEFIKEQYPKESPIHLHSPRFIGNEKKYLGECIDSTYVSYTGKFLSRFEQMIKDFTGAKHAIATSNGTLALHAAMVLSGVKPGDEVLTQTLTFVATANAISYAGAKCIFIDSEKETMGMCPEKLDEFLTKNCMIKDDGFTYNNRTGCRISACVPVHVFGHPVKIEEISRICLRNNIALIEDAAESLGSYYKSRHTGLFGKMGVLSFNGNKTITTGGGGMVITNDDELAARALHITKTSKIPHQWEFIHDEVGYNYRLSNLSASVGCAQMECLDVFLKNKRELAGIYREFFSSIGMDFVTEPRNCHSNYWLNAIILKDRTQRDLFLEETNANGIMTRPIWRLMSRLPMYKDCESTSLDTAKWLEDRVVNIPSSVRL